MGKVIENLHAISLNQLVNYGNATRDTTVLFLIPLSPTRLYNWRAS